MSLKPIVVDLDALNLLSLLPVGILVAGALAIICFDLISSKLTKGFYTIASFVIFALSFVSLIGYQGSSRGFFNLILIDGIGILASLIIIVVSVFFLFFSMSGKDFHDTSMSEFYALYLFMSAGFMMMCLSDNLILIFVGLETGSLALYTIIAMHNRLKSIEAAIKYFTMGALASGLFAFCALLFYTIGGSVELGQIQSMLIKRDLEPLYGVIAASVFLLASLGFKLSLIPFHTWTPDVYEGSSSQMAGYMSIVPKIASFIVVMRIFEMLSYIGIAWVDVMLYIVAIVTMSLANVMALIQKDVKRMLAFSSISHAGFLLCAIFIGSDYSNHAFFMYWMMFFVANLGAFGVLWIARHKQPLWDERFEHPYEKFSGLIKTSPLTALMMGVFMVSLAGIPPFSLFWGKLFLMGSAVNEGYYTLAVIMALNSAIALYYYLKLVVFMFLKEPISNKLVLYNNSVTMKVVIAMACFASIGALFFVDPLMDNIAYYLSMTKFW
ncbi:MAG: NADH-quinone oxidoreductase subunit NuoN [Proteobacteria bacterium]|nr:MAG: NADH-quinone oxidoreductase subunit NuoN [Pseudomonadota bacterium]